jgi:hypothetical protein
MDFLDGRVTADFHGICGGWLCNGPIDAAARKTHQKEATDKQPAHVLLPPANSDILLFRPALGILGLDHKTLLAAQRSQASAEPQAVTVSRTFSEEAVLK